MEVRDEPVNRDDEYPIFYCSVKCFFKGVQRTCSVFGDQFFNNGHRHIEAVVAFQKVRAPGADGIPHHDKDANIAEGQIDRRQYPACQIEAVGADQDTDVKGYCGNDFFFC